MKKPQCETGPLGACRCGTVARNRNRWAAADAVMELTGEDVRLRRELARREGVALSSLKVLAWIARRIADADLRAAHIPWSHFQIIAGEPERHRAKWIAVAEAQRLSVRQLKTRIVQYRFGYCSMTGTRRG